MAPLFHRLPILSANPFAVEATKFTPSVTLWLAVFMPSTAAFLAFPATIVTPSPSFFPAFTIVFPKLEATYFIPFPARLATFPTGTKFRSVHPAAMSLSFDDNSFPVIGSLPVTARIASFTPMNSAAL